jgi:predicted CDP-diglyceride synthetase/phosphatidate cytidylyltransferase
MQYFKVLTEIQQMILVILGVLVFATTLFWIWKKIKPGPQVDELMTRTKSWWVMASIFTTAAVVHPLISFIAFGLLSFGAFREISSISKNARIEDRSIIFWAYLAIPLQYGFAYMGWFVPFLILIPVGMFMLIPFLLVLKGHTQDIARSMSVIPTHLMLTVFSISHLAYLLSLPKLPLFNAGGRGLLLFVVFLTVMNDVFQFTWGKLLGRHKIIEKIAQHNLIFVVLIKNIVITNNIFSYDINPNGCLGSPTLLARGYEIINALHACHRFYWRHMLARHTWLCSYGGGRLLKLLAVAVELSYSC